LRRWPYPALHICGGIVVGGVMLALGLVLMAAT
jgi:hypothetical protein